MKAKDKLLDSLKKAMQGERDAVNLYKDAAEKSGSLEVKEFFLDMMREEQRHFNALLEYYKSLEKDGDLPEISEELNIKNMKESFFSDDFLKRISEDQALFSAISTALLLEKNAFAHYSQMAAEQDNPTLKSFFEVMAAWEKKHYDELLIIQKDAEGYYWQINDFTPF